MSQSTRTETALIGKTNFPTHGWLGILLVAVFWILNWSLPGVRTYWAFFPLWLGYSLLVDALVFARTGSSLLIRNWGKYIGLFLVSAPVWWIFELVNLRTQNWIYLGAEQFSSIEYAFWTTLSFTTVIPAVFGSAELIASSRLFHRRVNSREQKPKTGLIIRPGRLTTLGFFILGWIMLGLLFYSPRLFFPFTWLSLFFIIEPLNIWLGNRSLAESTRVGDWRPIFTLWGGVLLTAFFWEMWNYFSYPKWTYQVTWGGWLHVFEMPLLGYGGYLPFALELYAIYHFLVGWLGDKKSQYIRLYIE